MLEGSRMATLFNQTNLSPGTSFAGSGGGGSNTSNFPTGITIGSNILAPTNSGTGFQFNAPILQGGNLNGQIALSNQGLGFIQPNTGVSIPCIYYDNSNATYLSNVSTAVINNMNYTLNTTANDPQYNPISFTLRPDQATKGGSIQAVFQWDAVDTGANYATVVGARGGTGFIGSIWPGYISMPFQIFGATVDVISDNETFFHCDGAEGAIGTISTGVNFISAENNLSSITDPSKQYTADMTALLSTFASLYPDCVNIAR